MEIERKFLVKHLPEGLDLHPHCEIEQGYLCSHPTVRIRRIDNRYVLTVKEHLRTDSSAIVNREEEFEMRADDYLRLREKCDGRLLSKTRYRILLRRLHADGNFDDLVAELDLFHGRHEGLMLVEVEFPHTLEADAFEPPDWFGADVSHDPRYRNSRLAASERPPFLNTSTPQ
ncbi:MAG: adenylate cyclase [bacterium P3]|nr:MAG: adenylate cyclase [bacterium P3]KWW42069.1 MAG: adenylate cyclase [bacterium F083]